MEELKSHCNTQDAAMLDRIECDVLTIGDLRKLAGVLDLHTAIMEGGKHNVVVREDAQDEAAILAMQGKPVTRSLHCSGIPRRS